MARASARARAGARDPSAMALPWSAKSVASRSAIRRVPRMPIVIVVIVGLSDANYPPAVLDRQSNCSQRSVERSSSRATVYPDTRVHSRGFAKGVFAAA